MSKIDKIRLGVIGLGRGLQSVLDIIIDDDVDRSILNMTAVGRDGMQQTDRLILDIMTNK